MNPIPSFQDLLKNPVMLLGFGFGSGLSPKAPGTVGTLAGMLIFIPLLLWMPMTALALLLFGTLLGATICGRSAELAGVHDHGGIVWDEFIGIWMALIFLPEQSWLYWVFAFVAFRFFDILKPWPIGWMDRKISGGLGILIDDIMAACYAIIIIWGIQTGFF